MKIRVEQAWDEGLNVYCKHRSHQEARYHLDSGTVLIKNRGKIRTILTRYDHFELEFRTKINCVQCGCHHHSRDECPNCGSVKWSIA